MLLLIRKIKAKIKYVYFKYYYSALIIMIIWLFIRIVGGTIYGNVYGEEIKQRESCLIEEVYNTIVNWDGEVSYVSTVHKTPAMSVNMQFIDKNGNLSIESVYDYFVSHNWNISSYNKKHKKIRAYNSKFICDCNYDKEKGKWSIGIKSNDVWTKMEWLEYIFL